MRNWLLVFALVPAGVFGQQLDSTSTSTYLEEVTVYGVPLSKYTAGTKVENISLNLTSFLHQELSASPSIYFKNYGNDQLSTIAFRGTSSSHTAVLWNGMNISSPTLGQTDFALLPSFLLEDVALQFGTSSSLFGSDALGGSVILNQSKPTFDNGWSVLAHQQVGSFGRYFSGVQVRLSNKRFESRTKLMDRWLENNFSYNSPSVGYSKKQSNAAVHTYGFDQQFHFKISDKSRIAFETLYTFNHREIQPPVTNNNDQSTLQDQNARFSLSYDGDHTLGHVYTSLGYFYNNELYNVTSRTKSEQSTAIINIDKPLGDATSIRFGGSGSIYKVQSDGIENNKTENRYDVFTSLNRFITPRWDVSVNLRQGFYAGRQSPFSPSIGTQYQIVTTSKYQLKFRTQISRGYRIPTLNDRYWNPGGNPELKSEDAKHIEGGFEWKTITSAHHIRIDITGFRTLVDHWILWRPIKGIWSPTNLQKVNAYGLETAINDVINVGENANLNIGINYSLNRSKNLVATSNVDQNTVNKQLPYVPYHLANAYAKLTYGDWIAEVNSNYTSMRFTNLSNERYQGLEAYALVNAHLSHIFLSNQLSIKARVDINNLLNTYYETMENLAMPGRNYNLNLTIQLKNKTKE